MILHQWSLHQIHNHLNYPILQLFGSSSSEAVSTRNQMLNFQRTPYMSQRTKYMIYCQIWCERLFRNHCRSHQRNPLFWTCLKKKPMKSVNWLKSPKPHLHLVWFLNYYLVSFIQYYHINKKLYGTKLPTNIFIPVKYWLIWKRNKAQHRRKKGCPEWRLKILPGTQTTSKGHVALSHGYPSPFFFLNSHNFMTISNARHLLFGAKRFHPYD